jgi:hypothetical protein
MKLNEGQRSRANKEPIASSEPVFFLNTMFYFFSSLVSDGSGGCSRTVPDLHREGAAPVKVTSNYRVSMRVISTVIDHFCLPLGLG